LKHAAMKHQLGEKVRVSSQRASVSSTANDVIRSLNFLPGDGVDMSYKTSIITRATRRHIPEDGILHKEPSKASVFYAYRKIFSNVIA
jgi:hypothetical protein